MPYEPKIREAHIQLESGVTLVAEVSTIQEVRDLISYLRHNQMVKPDEETKKHVNRGLQSEDRPEGLVELKADISSGSLSSKKILAFKDGVPQLLKTTHFGSVTDAVVVLLYAVEFGLRRSKIPYEEFKSLYEGQSLKSGSSLSLLVNNLKNDGYIDKKVYDADRQLTLTAKGATKGADVLQAIAGKSA
jgi:hypothetical protein